MFLKQIKIVGFKSFVEPTVLQFNSPRVAIVGPNGCGKSNVIDAIRWVMGESSAKFLRSDLMSDVIFNGSSKRKPVGMASVELLLDNHAKDLEGAYIGQGEISIRREVNRSGDSSYYINARRVRRKDLTDLWLGTGAGARGYAIIGQNMVNQLVEANPEGLKAYLEEAAGVSKYKERRSESAKRLLSVQDNLGRIADIVFDLSEQLERLEVEAKAALTYQSMRQEFRLMTEKYRLVKARAMFNRLGALEKKLNNCLQEELGCDEQTLKQESYLTTLNAQIDALTLQIKHDEHILMRLEMDYELQEKNHLARQEELAHSKIETNALVQEGRRLVEQIKKDKLQVNHDALEIKKWLENHQEWEGELKQLEEQVKNFKDIIFPLQTSAQQSKETIHDRQIKIQVHKAQLEQLKDSIKEIITHKKHFEQSVQDDEIPQLLAKKLELRQKITPLEGSIVLEQTQFKTLEIAHQSLLDDVKVMILKRDDLQKILENNRQHLFEKEASYQGLLASMTTLEEPIKEQWQATRIWLETWTIPQAWQKTVDCIWQDFLPHYFSKSFHWQGETLPKAYYAKMLDLNQRCSDYPLTRLLDVMGVQNYPSGFLDWSKVYTVDSLIEAYAHQSKLCTGESVLSADGVWMGADWVYFFNSNLEQEAGIATRLNAWQKAKDVFFNFNLTYQEHIASLIILEEKAKGANTSFEMAREHIAKLQHELHHLIQEEKQLEQAIKLLEAHVSRQKTDLERLENQYVKMISDEKRIDEQLKIFQEQLAKEEENYQSIQRKLSICQTQLSEAYGVLEKKRSLLEENQLQITKRQIQLDYLVASIPKNQLQEKTITDRLRYLESLLDKQSKELLTTEWFGLQKKAIGEQKSVVSDKGSQLLILESDFKALTFQLEQIKRDKLQFMEKKWRLQTEKEQAEYHLKQLSEEFQQELQESLWSELDNDKTEEYYKKNMVYLENKLTEMGDINLLAAGLFEQEKIRYEQLMAQQNDLKLAMSELSLAIHTLDADMQIRLQETLLAINSHLSVIFPQLFGGGEAKFVASCDNLLEATVAVHVQVPGKKQLRIQLLSGGEKALTAVALLFSIFSLNPAPFCLLDEVDAALDDANVQRLVSLIKALSNTVQFVLITHNPLTMDAAEELIGVTMQEPGVSRVVSVNMTKALALVNKE